MVTYKYHNQLELDAFNLLKTKANTPMKVFTAIRSDFCLEIVFSKFVHYFQVRFGGLLLFQSTCDPRIILTDPSTQLNYPPTSTCPQLTTDHLQVII